METLLPSFYGQPVAPEKPARQPKADIWATAAKAHFVRLADLPGRLHAASLHQCQQCGLRPRHLDRWVSGGKGPGVTVVRGRESADRCAAEIGSFEPHFDRCYAAHMSVLVNMFWILERSTRNNKGNSLAKSPQG